MYKASFNTMNMVACLTTMLSHGGIVVSMFQAERKCLLSLKGVLIPTTNENISNHATMTFGNCMFSRPFNTLYFESSMVGVCEMSESHGNDRLSRLFLVRQ